MKNLIIAILFLLPFTISAQLLRSYGVVEIGTTFPSSTSTGAKYAYRPVDSSFYRWVSGSTWVKVVNPSINPLYLKQVSGTTSKFSGDTINLIPYLLKTDTASMLSSYINLAGWGLSKLTKTLQVDSSKVATRFYVQNIFLAKTDTAAMLAKYIERGDTASMLTNYPSTAGYGIIDGGKTWRADTTSPNGLATKLFTNRFALGTGTLNQSARWSGTNTLAVGNITDNGGRIIMGLPQQFKSYTTAGLPTGSDLDIVENSTTGFLTRYKTGVWENLITSTGATNGQVTVFSSAGKTYGTNNLFWNNSTLNLGVRTSSPHPSFPITLEGTAASGGNLAMLTYAGANKYHINLQNSGDAFSINQTGVLDGRLYINGNLIGMHTTTPNLNLEVGGTLGIRIPNGNSAQRPSNFAGTIRFNNSLSPVRLEYNDGSGWQSIARMLDVSVSGFGADGQVTFWSGASTNIAGSNNFNWNNTLRQLGLNCSTPGSVLGVNAVSNGNYIAFQRSGTEIFKLESQGTTDIGFTESGVASGRLSLKKGGLVGINNNNPSYNLDISGTLGFAFRRSNGDTIVIRGERVMLKSNTAFPYFGISDKLENNYMYWEKSPAWVQEKLSSNYRYAFRLYTRGVYSNVITINQDTTMAIRQNDIIYGQKGTVFGSPGFDTRHVFLSNMNNKNNHAILIEATTTRTNLFSISNLTDSVFHIYANGTAKAAKYGQGNKEAVDLSKTQSAYIAGFATDGTLLDYPLSSLGNGIYGGSGTLSQHTTRALIPSTGNLLFSQTYNSTDSAYIQIINNLDGNREVRLGLTDTMSTGYANLRLFQDEVNESMGFEFRTEDTYGGTTLSGKNGSLSVYADNTLEMRGAEIRLNNGEVLMNQYGQGNMKSTDLGVSDSKYVAKFSTNGRVTDYYLARDTFIEDVTLFSVGTLMYECQELTIVSSMTVLAESDQEIRFPDASDALRGKKIIVYIKKKEGGLYLPKIKVVGGVSRLYFTTDPGTGGTDPSDQSELLVDDTNWSYHGATYEFTCLKIDNAPSYRWVLKQR